MLTAIRQTITRLRHLGIPVPQELVEMHKKAELAVVANLHDSLTDEMRDIGWDKLTRINTIIGKLDRVQRHEPHRYSDPR